jgi:hypothetical protein
MTSPSRGSSPRRWVVVVATQTRDKRIGGGGDVGLEKEGVGVAQISVEEVEGEGGGVDGGEVGVEDGEGNRAVAAGLGEGEVIQQLTVAVNVQGGFGGSAIGQGVVPAQLEALAADITINALAEGAGGQGRDSRWLAARRR